MENKESTTTFWINKIIKNAKNEERELILNRLCQDDIYNSHVQFAINKLQEEFALEKEGEQ